MGSGAGLVSGARIPAKSAAAHAIVAVAKPITPHYGIRLLRGPLPSPRLAGKISEVLASTAAQRPAAEDSSDAPACEPGAAIEARALRRDFGDEPVLRDVTLTLDAGATLVVLGPNGAGKSTLLRMLATLLRPTAGDLRVLGADLPRRAWRARGLIGYLGHDPLLYRDLTLEEALGFHARLHGLADPAARIAELLDAVGLARRRDQLVRTLSAGQLQRAAVCRCVLHAPSLLLLDEPGAHLDPAAVETVAPLIGPAEGMTRVVVTHDFEGGLASADRALALRADGTVAYEGPAAGLSPGDARSLYSGIERPGAPGIRSTPGRLSGGGG
jgi:heme exporter protein A